MGVLSGVGKAEQNRAGLADEEITRAMAGESVADLSARISSVRGVEPFGAVSEAMASKYSADSSRLVTCEGTGYTRAVAILGFRHKGLELFFSTGKTSRIQAQHAERLRLILGRLNVATEPRDLNLPGLRLHPLKGNRRGSWAVSVNGNWRVTFGFVGKDVDGVDYEDYH